MYPSLNELTYNMYSSCSILLIEMFIVLAGKNMLTGVVFIYNIIQVLSLFCVDYIHNILHSTKGS